MKNLVLVFLFLLTTQLIFAQPKSLKIDLESEAEKISIKNIWIDSVIDNRFIRGSIGIAQRGLNNRKTPILLKDSVESIKRYINESIFIDNDKSKKIIIVLNQLWLSERTGGFSEKGVCEIEVDVCKKDSNGLLIKQFEFIDEVEGKTMFDITASHATRIKEVLQKLAFFADTTQNIQHEPYTFTTLDTTSNILTNPVLKKGAYKNFVLLFNNKPKDLPNLSLKKTRKKAEFYSLTDSLSNKKIKNYYAYSDGQDLYLNAFSYGQNVSNYYSKVVSFGRYLLIDDSNIDNTAMLSGYGAFGILGGLIGAAAFSTRGAILDVKTGISIVLSDKNFLKLVKPYPSVANSIVIPEEGEIDFDVKKNAIDQINQIEAARLKKQ